MARDDLAKKGRQVWLHAGPREAIGPAIEMLGRWFDLTAVVIGGGTALEARWHQAFDPVSFRDALAHLDEEQAHVIAETFDALADTPPRAEGRGVEAPAYPAILERGLWKLATQIFRNPQRDLGIAGVDHRVR